MIYVCVKVIPQFENFPFLFQVLRLLIMTPPRSLEIVDYDNILRENNKIRVTPFFYKQSIFDPRPENCLSFSKKPPQKIV